MTTPARGSSGRTTPWRRVGWAAGTVTALALVLLALVPAGGAAAPGEPVAVRTGIHRGFARLALEWPHAIAVDDRRQGDRLTLRFARPLVADLASVVADLEGYLQGIARGGDGQEITLRLAPGVEAELDVYERRIVVVDLTRVAPVGDQAVELRTGSHDGFGRIVLDWAEPVGYEASQSGRRWRVVFAREATIDAAAIGRRFDGLLEEARSGHGDGRSELALTLKNGVAAKVFEMPGGRVVIDLAEPAEALRQPEPEAGLDPAAIPDDAGPDAPPQARPVAAPAPTPQMAAPVPAGAPAQALSLQILAAEGRPDGGLDFLWSRPVPAAFLIRAGHLWAVFAPPADQAATLPALTSPLPGYLAPGEQVDTQYGIALRFALRRPLAATVERDGARWRVHLGTTARPPLPAQIERQAKPPRLRIDAGEPVRLVRVTDPEVGDELVVWPLLAAGRGQPAGRRLVDLDLLTTAQGLAWRAHSDDLRAEVNGDAVELIAGEGLRLSASDGAPPAPPPPLVESGRAPEPEPSAPAAVTAAASEVQVEKTLAEVVAADDPRAAGSEAADEDRPAAVEDEDPPADRLGLSTGSGADDTAGALDLARFAKAAPTRSVLQQRIAEAAPEERAAARLELVRWFLSRAMAPEALAVLEVLSEPQPTSAHASLDADRHRLAAAAAMLVDRLDDAAAVLGEPALDDDPEIALWRAALAAAREDWPRGARELGRAQTVLAAYPAALQVRLGLPAVAAASEAGDHQLAKRVLDAIAQLDLDPLQRARLAFQQGLAQARRGSIDRADTIWRGLEEGDDYETRIKAAWFRVQTLLEAGRLTPDEALAKLAPARALWRGHPAEARMLDGLARLYRQSGDHASAIRTWQDLLAAFPALAAAGRIRELMADSFAEALQPGATIGAVRAYALYQDFPELMPDGVAADSLRHGLAAQLAGLDLVEPAAALLAEVIEQRPSGVARAAAGAELAELWLRVPDPAATLAALDRTAIANDLAPPLAARRRVLQAKALVAADRPDEALALLAGRPSRSEQLQRAEILWQIRDWPRLAAALESLLDRRTDPTASLSAEEQDLVLRLAVAYAQQTDAGALERLRGRFGPAMRGEAGEPAFLMATMGPSRTVAPEAVLAVAAEHLARVQSYLDTAPALP